MWIIPSSIALFIAAVILVFIPTVRIAGKIIFSLLIPVAAFFGVLFVFVLIALGAPQQIWLMIPIIVCAAAIIYGSIYLMWGRKRRRIHCLSAFGTALACALLISGVFVHNAYLRNIPTVADGGNVLYNYAPYRADNKTVTLEKPSSLVITSDFPSLDGATALYPVYAAFAKAIYPADVLDKREVLTCTTTTDAYDRLIRGEVDMIFVASASERQAKTAADAGIELTFTPIGREAFVFFVNSKNPVNGLTTEQIRLIYSGRITNWSSLGAPRLGNIRAFQRDEGSGSQTALERLMQGHELIAPIKEDVVSGMGGIISRTADYKNYRNAIGFSFRFYSTEMVKNNHIKLLAIDGVAPTRENIINNTYPICAEFYVVTTQNSNARCADIIEWILSEQGQYIIEKTGYVGIGIR